MNFLIDADSLIYKAGCSNETRTYYVQEGDNVLADFTYKKDAKQWIEDQGIAPEAVDIVFTKEAGPVGHSLSNINNMLGRIVDHRRCGTFQVFISGDGNFRYDIDPEYKGQRDPNSRPIHEEQIRQHLIKHWGAETVDGIEVDDLVSILAMEEPDTNVIVTIDKDLDNTPGWHYNYDKEKAYWVTDEEADLYFYRQMLSGDPVDNIKGVKGIGKKRAEEILPHPLTTERLCSIVYNVYKENDYDFEYFLKQGRLLWMLREHGKMWNPPASLAFEIMDEEDAPQQI